MFEVFDLLTFRLTMQWKIYPNSSLQSVNLSIKQLTKITIILLIFNC